MKTGILRAASRGLLPLVAICSPVQGQEAEISATVSSDTVEIGEVFELRVRLPVAPGRVVYFPDTVPASPQLESFAPVEWSAEREGHSGVTLALTYALIPFSTGTIPVPTIDVLTGPVRADTEGEPVPGGSIVRVWADAGLPTGATARIPTPDLQVWVDPPYTADDVVEGLSPRPPGDVAGPSWSLASVALILLFSSVIGTAGVATTRDWLERRAVSSPAARARGLTLDEARRAAVAQLDRLLAECPETDEQVRLLYKASSSIIRRYVERFEAEWGPELTSTELMDRLTASNGASHALLDQMSTAEAVKFGPLRPDATTLEQHLGTLRVWLAEAGEEDP